MRRVAVALVAIMAVVLVAAIGLARAQSNPDCTATRCTHLPLVMGPPPTPTATATATQILATSTPILTPTATATTVPPTIGPTKTPTLPPPTYDNCQDDPNPNAAPDYPITIVAIDKAAETVTIRNVTTSDTIDLTGWDMCSIAGNQHHPISGTLAPGETRTFSGPTGSIWNNSSPDPGALYNPSGQLASYYFD